MKNIIGLYGLMESGKDEVAKFLIGRHGYTRFSIGDYIRAEVAQGVPPDLTHYPLRVTAMISEISTMLRKGKDPMELLCAKPTPPEVRHVLQWWGEYRRSQNPQYWNEMLLRRMEAHNKDGNLKAVISDIRMPVEYHLVEKLKGENWMIVRAHCMTKLPYGDLHAHGTETALRNYEFKQYIANNGDILDLGRLVDMIVREYGL